MIIQKSMGKIFSGFNVFHFRYLRCQAVTNTRQSQTAGSKMGQRTYRPVSQSICRQSQASCTARFSRGNSLRTIESNLLKTFLIIQISQIAGMTQRNRIISEESKLITTDCNKRQFGNNDWYFWKKIDCYNVILRVFVSSRLQTQIINLISFFFCKSE